MRSEKGGFPRARSKPTGKMAVVKSSLRIRADGNSRRAMRALIGSASMPVTRVAGARAGGAGPRTDRCRSRARAPCRRQSRAAAAPPRSAAPGSPGCSGHAGSSGQAQPVPPGSCAPRAACRAHAKWRLGVSARVPAGGAYPFPSTDRRDTPYRVQIRGGQPEGKGHSRRRLPQERSC